MKKKSNFLLNLLLNQTFSVFEGKESRSTSLPFQFPYPGPCWQQTPSWTARHPQLPPTPQQTETLSFALGQTVGSNVPRCTCRALRLAYGHLILQLVEVVHGGLLSRDVPRLQECLEWTKATVRQKTGASQNKYAVNHVISFPQAS